MGDIIAIVVMGVLAIGGFTFLGVITLLEKIVSGKGSGIMKAGIGAFFAKKVYDSFQSGRQNPANQHIPPAYYGNQLPQYPEQSCYQQPHASHIPPPTDCEGLR